MSRKLLHRAAYRRGDLEGRRVTYTAATESPVDTGLGPEVLLMSGCDLSDYDRNPVVLDAHRRGSCSDVIGQAVARVEGRELVAEVTYLEDQDAERVFSKIRAGAIRAVSVGYVVDESSVQRLRDGETAEGVTGPALLVRRWKVIEISNVPVPADANALRREFYTRALAGEETPMDEDEEKKPEDEAREESEDETREDAEGEDQEQTPGDRARELMAEAEELGITREEMAEACDREAEALEELAEGDSDDAPEDLIESLVELLEDKRKRMAEEEAAREEAEDEAREDDEEAKAERKRKKLKARKAAFVAAAPAELRDLAEDVFLANPRRSQSATWSDAVELAPKWAKREVLRLIRERPTASLEQYRSALLELRQARMKPSGQRASGQADKPTSDPNNPTPSGSTPKDYSGCFGG